MGDQRQTIPSLIFSCLIGGVIALVGCSKKNRDATTGESTPTPEPQAPAQWNSLPLNTPRTATAGKPRFHALSVKESGLDFVNDGPPVTRDAEGNAIRFGTLSGADTAGGVSVGDYDGDGLADIYLTRAVGGNLLFRNQGGMRFEDVTLRAGLDTALPRATGASFVDIDNDGDLDLYVCGYDCANQLWINRGDGSFSEQAKAHGLDFHGASVMMAFADYDLDGDVDAYLLTNHLAAPGEMDAVKVEFDKRTGKAIIPPEKQEVMGAILRPDGTFRGFLAGQFDRLYRNDSGRFVEVGKASGISGAHMGLSVTWWDYNADGLPDLYVANDFYGQDHLYRNEGNGKFLDVTRYALPHTPWFSMGSDVADINNDGRLDYMASDMAGSNHYRSKIGMGDMEEQGWFLTYPSPRQYMRNAVYLNTGTDRFMEVAHMTGLARSDWTWSVKFGDLDNDGWNDVYITNGMTRDLFHSDWKEKEARSRTEAEGHALWAGAPRKKDENLALRNTGHLHFEPHGKAWGLNHVGVTFGAALGDLDNDGDLDIVANHFGEPATVYENRSPASNRVRLRLRGDGETVNRQALGATVRLKTAGTQQVRYLTLARGYMSTDEPVIHFGLGEHETIDELRIEWPGGFTETHAGLPANRLYTFTHGEGSAAAPSAGKKTPPRFVYSPLLGQTRRDEKPFDDFLRQPLLPNKLSQLGPGMAWGDVNGDGRDDLYVSRSAGHGGMIYTDNGRSAPPDKRFSANSLAPFAADAACEDMAPLFFDADGDGDLDLYVVSGGVECEPGDPVLRDRLYRNDGKGTFVRAKDALPDLRDSGSVVTGADWDRDGDIDLFVGARVVPGRWPETPENRLLRNDGGRFTDATEAWAPQLRRTGLVTSALWSDVDNDGWLDLLVTHEWGPVKVFRNGNGKALHDRTGDAGLAALSGWWNGIAGGDIDHDGDIDFAISNFGLNTQYHARPEEPQLLFYGDFDGTGKKRILEAEFEGEICYPKRGLSCSRNAMPFLRNKISTFHQFATASLTELYSEARLQDALRLEATQLASGILINESAPGRPSFRYQPLPRLAQASPAFGLAFADVDADGHLDLYMVQNFFGPQRETGRMDGGVSLLLSGDGKGGFTSVWPDQSGLLVPGDARSLTVCDLNGDLRPDFVVGVNSGGMLTFFNRGAAAEHMVALKLEGKTGNLTAIGARVTCRFSDGTNSTAEVYAGGGYLSQSAPMMHFGVGSGRIAKSVTVRWPDGSEDHYPLEAGRDRFVIHQR